MRGLSPNESAALRKLKAALTRDFRLVELRLFGSKARGDSDQESDIDVLVVLEDYDWEVEKAVCDLCFAINLEFHVLLSPVLYRRSEFDSDLTHITPFYQAVTREGIVV
ncbi:MAG: nucleotidyltransferase domain-containing protein [candidate division WOR-3 bacterium]|nr:nucleotidyltransferase domain-containing protein [candidate division WOR-3 bacterium]